MTLRRNYARYGAATTFFDSVEEFLNRPLPRFQHGEAEALSIRYGAAFMDLLIEDRDADTTIILFHAAIDPSKTTLPVFVGRQTVEGIDANLVYVSDPSLDHGASIGWFTGDEARLFQDDLTECLRHILASFYSDASTTESGRKAIFFGGSAGGFAAMYFSHRFPGSLAVVSNPQTHIGRYFEPQVKAYRKKCWSSRKLSETSMTFDLVTEYAKSFNNYVAYLQNKDDDLHYSQHFLPWSQAVADHPERWRVLIGDWGEGHAPAPQPLLMGILGFAATLNGNWEQLFEDEVFSDPN
ncbi:hypothetical protein ACL1EX_11390 [Corynebacterium striatum]